MRRVIAAIVIIAVVSFCGCATRSGNIPAAYVSQNQYTHLSCDDLIVELAIAEDELDEISAKQDRAATNDAVAMGVSAIVFAPALIWFCVDNDREEEVAHLKGKVEAIKDVMKSKCKGE